MGPLTFGDAEEFAASQLIGLALKEDLGIGLSKPDSSEFDLSSCFSVTSYDSLLDSYPLPPASDLDRDLTCAALIDPDERATINVVVRRDGVLSGSPIGELVFDSLSLTVGWESLVADGSRVSPQTIVARVTGSLRSLLVGERTVLNFLQHLSGVATLTRKFVDVVSGTNAVILDTRKTLPGWRVLEKYAVRCGGGANHRMGLFDGVLIKDNHLAAWRDGQKSEARNQNSENSGSVAQAVRVARMRSLPGTSIEVEVDTLDQLRDALSGEPEIVLLDNMNPATLRNAVQMRNELRPAVRLEASGGITLENVREIAETGVERISVGALTHSAPALDIAFDWNSLVLRGTTDSRP